MSKKFFYAIKSTDFLSSSKNIAWQNYGMLCENISVIHSVKKLSDNRQQKSVKTNITYIKFSSFGILWNIKQHFLLFSGKNHF